jgi:small conductance mechanosensitive channel
MMGVPMGSILQQLGEWVMSRMTSAVRVLLVLAVAFVLTSLVRRFIHKIERMVEDEDPDSLTDREKRSRTLGKVLRQTLTAGIWLLAIVTVLSELGVSIGPLLTGAGIAGLAVGFGAQALVKDMISGFFMLLENQYRVGDEVSIAGVKGLVEAVNLRTTVLRDLEGHLHIVPNGSVTVVTNLTRGWTRAMLDVPVPYREDTDRCYKVLHQVGSGLEQDPVFGPKLLGAFEYPGVERLDESAVLLRMMVRTRPHEEREVERELRRRVKQALDAASIEIPFPHRTVYYRPVELPRPPAGRADAPPGGEPEP